jgi:hypothetical protein
MHITLEIIVKVEFDNFMFTFLHSPGRTRNYERIE